MTPIIKSWPFRGWKTDLIGKIHHPTVKRDTFIIIATDLLTKLVVTIPLVEISQKNIFDFIRDHINHRFGIHQTLMVDDDISLNGDKVMQFLNKKFN